MYILGPDSQSNDWYAKNMPRSTTSMDVYSAVLNLSSSDFKNLKQELSSSLFD